jgi:hypothetical protein
MNGLMGVLEKTGFVRAKDGDADAADAGPYAAQEPGAAPAADVPPEAAVSAPAPVEQQLGIGLQQVYERAGVPASTFPAEKLVRLLEGLKTMDEATRRVAVAAMDAADDSWTIEDPIRDAVAKVQALGAHGLALRSGVEQAEAETALMISQVKDREAATVTDIRRQIADLEGLLAREIARSAQEQAELQAAMQVRRDGANRQIEQLDAVAADFKRLIAQFGAAVPAGSPAGHAA